MSWEQNQGGWQLVVLDGPTAGRRVPVQGQVTIGRAPDMTVSMPQDGYLSGRHIRIEPSPAGLQLLDLGSTNGSYLNGERFANTTALAGDQLRVGSLNLAVEGPVQRQQAVASPAQSPSPQPASPFFNAPAFTPAAPPAFAERPVQVNPPQDFFGQPASFPPQAEAQPPAWPAPPAPQPPTATPERSPWELIAPSLSQASQPQAPYANPQAHSEPSPEPAPARARAVQESAAASSASPWNSVPAAASVPETPTPDVADPFAWLSQPSSAPSRQPETAASPEPAAAAERDPWAGLAAAPPAVVSPAVFAPSQPDPWAGLADPAPVFPKPLPPVPEGLPVSPPAEPAPEPSSRSPWADSPWGRRGAPLAASAASPQDEAEATAAAPSTPEPQAAPAFESFLSADTAPAPEPEPLPENPQDPPAVAPTLQAQPARPAIAAPMPSAPASPTAEAALSILSALSMPLFALVDAGADPQIPDFLQRAALQVPTQSLFEGERAASFARWAPYLLDLRAADPASGPVLGELIHRGWGRGWASFFVSEAPFSALRAQLQPSLGLFRFYDPRVLRDFLPSAQPHEAAAFFGPVEAWLLEGDGGARLYRLGLGPDGALNTRSAALAD